MLHPQVTFYNSDVVQVWQKLKLGWEKLCDFVGFVFDWQDILHTKKAIKDMINSGSDFLAFKVESAKDKIDSYAVLILCHDYSLCLHTYRFFGDIDDKVDTIKGLLGSQTAKELISQDVQEDDQMKGYMESPAAKWVGERMRNANSEMTAKGTGTFLIHWGSLRYSPVDSIARSCRNRHHERQSDAAG
jgi:hypothetical protein